MEKKDTDHEDVHQNTSTNNHKNLSARQLALDRLETIVTSLANKIETQDNDQNQTQEQSTSRDSISSEQQQFENSKDLVDQLQNRINTLENEKVTYSQEMEQRVNTLVKEAITEATTEAREEAKITESSLAQRIQELESEIDVQSTMYNSIQESLKAKIKELEENTENFNNQEQTDQIKHLSATLEELRTTNDQLKLDVETERELHKQHTDKYNNIESQIKELEETNETLKDELAVKVQEIEAFEQTKSGEIAQLSQSFEENSERLKEMFTEQQQLQAMNQELKLANAQSNRETEKLLQEKESEITNLNETLELTRGEHLELQKRFELLEDNSSSKDEDLKNLNLTLEEKCKEYECLIQTKDELQEKNSELANLVGTKEGAIEKLLSEKDDKIAVLNTTVNKFKAEMMRLDSHCLTLEGQNLELVSLISSKESEIEKLLSEKDDELAALNTTIGENKAEMVRLDTHCSALQEHNLTLEQTIQNQMDEFQESLSCREKEIDLLNKSVEETTGGLLRLKEQNQKLLTDAQQLVEKNLGQSYITGDDAIVDNALPKQTVHANIQGSRTDDDGTATSVVDDVFQEEGKHLKGLQMLFYFSCFSKPFL